MEYGILTGTNFDIRHLFILVTCLINISIAQYKWKPSEWSSCICGLNGQGQQSRHISCMYEDRYGGLSYTEETNCGAMPMPLSQRPCYEECMDNRYPIIDQYQVTWAIETWGPCQLMPRVTTCARGMGIRYRNVTCVFKSNGKLQNDSVCLSFEAKPSTREGCDLQCKQDCIVTPWESWTFCDNCEKTSRTRTRNVVIPENHGGKECPPFSEIEKCSNCSNVYYISVEKWSPCVTMTTIPDNFPSHSLIGHQERAVKCLDSNGATVPYTKCKEHVKLSGQIIADHQSCIIPQDCVVSSWSPWQPINSSCVLETGFMRLGLLRREREVKKLPRGLGQSCPPLEETTTVQGIVEERRYCPRTKWIMSGWSKCMAVNGGLQCTTGMQHRKAICVEENEKGEQKPVKDSLCTNPRPTISQLCPADCDWDCTVSLWTPWTDCTVTECDQYARKRRNNQKTGQRYRTREILTPPGKNGQQCPHLSETQNCDPEPCYFWNTSSGPCSLESRYGAGSGENCGVGIKQQTTTCVDKKGMRVRDELCSEWEARPEAQMLCVIPCRQDCVTSEWGEWSECPDICETEQDVAYRPSMRSRQKTILARNGLGGTECPGERELIENKPCPTVIECAVFIWSADPWSDCVLDVPGVQCGQGRQTRGVHCYNRNNQFVQDEKCTQSVKPDTVKSCIIPCPQDCHHTDWSEWSSCSASCISSKENFPTKSRQRYILKEPDNGGAPCPEVLQKVEQCTGLPLCNQMQWVVSNWSQCILAPTVYHCGKGLRARDITCKALNGTEHPIEECLKFLGPMPQVAEACYKSCDKDCVFTDWSEWSHCVQGCRGHQFKSRELTGGLSSPAKCRNTDIYPTYKKRPCMLCSKPTTAGDWSDCILEPVRHDYITNQPELTSSRGKRTRNTTSLDMGNVCGTGKRIKVVACSREGSGLEPAEKCNGSGHEEEVCMIPCPVDCEMSDWTTWSECPAKCGAGVQTRYRSIRRLPSAGGRQCPSLGSKSKETQTRLCHPECVRYVWKTKTWGTCMMNSAMNCGNGTQTRHVRCEAVNRHGYTTGTATDDMCTGIPRPPHVQHCYMYCLHDCVVSEWTPWTQCSKPCNHNDRQLRTREVLRYWNYNNCPEIRETKPCIKNDNCIEYYWEWSQWTTCLINNGMDDCGVGHKERYTICKNHFGQTVDNEYCEQDADPVTEPAVVSCEVVCDVDCLVSEWSRWSSCSTTCGLGYSQRERTVVEQYSRNGRPCPDMLVQKKPCFLRGCYNWAVSEWSNCTSQNGVCGHGIQKRNISCVSEDGINLDPSRCPPDLNVLIMDTERPCTVPCPGECVITEWSDWNTCYLSREDFHVDKYRSLGVQSRSRAVLAYPKLSNMPCPDKLWEKQHCVADEGMSFDWAYGPWSSEGTRTVWCQRSDGLIVTGGCDFDIRPPESLVCEPPCPQDSTCNDTNTCVCHPKKVPDYTAGGVLRACLLQNATIEPVAQEDAPKETSSTSIWMYAVLAAGTVFIIFVALAFYNMSEHFRSGPRPRGKEDEEAAEKLNTGTLDSHHQNGLDQVDNCPNVNTHRFAPQPTATNHLYENSTTNANLWVRASSKSVRGRIARKFYSMLYFCGCSKHVHDPDLRLDTYTAYVDNADGESYRRVPEVDYSDKPTISNQSSVDIEIVEMPKKSKITGSDSAISMQNSSNDSGRTVESLPSPVAHVNYSRPDKRFKRQGNSFDKQRSFDSYTIAEGEDVDDLIENNPGIVQLEHVPALSLKSSPKSSIDSKTNSLCFGGNIKPCDSEDDHESTPLSNGGSGLFSVHSNTDDTNLLDEMNSLLYPKPLCSLSPDLNTVNNFALDRKPSLGTKPKLSRQKQIVEADIEHEPMYKSNEHLNNLSVLEDKENVHADLRALDINDNQQISKVKGDKVHGSKTEIKKEESELDDQITSLPNGIDEIEDDDEEENCLTEESRTNSYDTFKDLASRKCHLGRKENKLSKTTTV